MTGKELPSWWQLCLQSLPSSLLSVIEDLILSSGLLSGHCIAHGEGDFHCCAARQINDTDAGCGLVFLERMPEVSKMNRIPCGLWIINANHKAMCTVTIHYLSIQIVCHSIWNQCGILVWNFILRIFFLHWLKHHTSDSARRDVRIWRSNHVFVLWTALNRKMQILRLWKMLEQEYLIEIKNTIFWTSDGDT